MNIEITKKRLIGAAISCILLAVAFMCGYFAGVKSMENPKGNGEHFYSEIQEDSGLNDHILKYYKVVYHSTLECTQIKQGIEMDGYGYVSSSKSPLPYYFCPACMDSELIKLCDYKVKEAFESEE